MSTKPKKAMMKIAAYLRNSGDIPVAYTMEVNARVKKIKLRQKPKITPKGRSVPFPLPAARMAGNKGRIQGDTTVTNPAIKANNNKISIGNLLK